MPITLKQTHDVLGHINNNVTIKKYKAIGLKLNNGNVEPYDVYAAVKSKQKNVPKKN